MAGFGRCYGVFVVVGVVSFLGALGFLPFLFPFPEWFCLL